MKIVEAKYSIEKRLLMYCTDFLRATTFCITSVVNVITNRSKRMTTYRQTQEEISMFVDPHSLVRNQRCFIIVV